MKKIISIVILIVVSKTLLSKIVEFRVDMTGLVIDSMGVYISGDFQSEAGFPGGDWQPNTSLMTQMPGSDIYNIVVDIPAMTKYEYKFLNGNHTYNVEFVPVESRVGFNFNDNRWIYIDSLANDTTLIGPIIFSGNAPVNKVLLRFKVNMSSSSVDPAGVHVAGSWQGWDPSQIYLYSFDGLTYEYIAYLDTGNYEFKYYNGNTIAVSETVPALCQSNGNRAVTLNADNVLGEVCFSSCNVCLTDINENNTAYYLKIFPNPSAGNFSVALNDNSVIQKIIITDIAGHIINSLPKIDQEILYIDELQLSKGIYYVSVFDRNENKYTAKLLIQ